MWDCTPNNVNQVCAVLSIVYTHGVYGKHGVRSLKRAKYGKYAVWKMRSVENVECEKCAVWKMKSVENAD